MSPSDRHAALARRGRGSVFLFSDVASAAQDFIEALAEHADPIWEQEEKDDQARRLADKAIEMLRDPEATW